jgi:hypothetical protein
MRHEMLLQASYQQANGDADPIILMSNLEGYYRPSTLDATALVETDPITIWEDYTANGEDAVDQTTSPLLHIDGTTGAKQARWNNAADSGLLIQADGGSMDFNAGDSFSLVVKIGETIGADSGALISKSQGSSANRQYQLSLNDATTGQFYLYGQTIDNAITVTSRSLIVITVDASEVNIWVDGVLEGSSPVTITGTGTANDNVYIGGRTGGYNPTCDIEMVAIFSKVLSGTEIGDIETFWQYN